MSDIKAIRKDIYKLSLNAHKRTETQKASTPGSNELLCLMPRELTAENGARFLLSGEFYETVSYACHECMDVGAEDGCEYCGGTGEISRRVYVNWTTIKEIYAMAVKHLAAKHIKPKQIGS